MATKIRTHGARSGRQCLLFVGVLGEVSEGDAAPVERLYFPVSAFQASAYSSSMAAMRWPMTA